jgi:hypothetical protein
MFSIGNVLAGYELEVTLTRAEGVSYVKHLMKRLDDKTLSKILNYIDLFFGSHLQSLAASVQVFRETLKH